MVGSRVSFPEYENWTERLQKAGGPWKWSRAEKNFPQNTSYSKHVKERTPDEIKASVLKSVRVKETICSEALRRKCPESIVEKEAIEMLDTMAHSYGLHNIRLLAVAVSKVLERIFDGIYVNANKVREVRELCKTDSVIFMPSHKTYLDFILLSLICFDYDVPLPAIAAGMDFMNSKLMGAVLRRNGAFFMRRSFGHDRLYWAVFSEYVQTHVVNSDRPLEFFVEATRSRVGKSLHPKYGLLQVLLEPYMRGHVYDMMIVPVSMNYDKILEEMLYSYELLGFPKPKESTSGLLKARDVLNKKFGKCFITFGDPISVRKYFGTSLTRSNFVCQPDSQFIVSQREKDAIKKFGHQVVKVHNENAVVTVWPLACMAILQKLDINDDSTLTYHSLYSASIEIYHLLAGLNVLVDISKSFDEDLRYYLHLHDDMFYPTNIDQLDFELRLKDFPVEKEGAVKKNIMERAVSRLVLTTYSNGMIHGVVDTGILALLIIQRGIISVKQLKEEFGFLQNLMKREFVCMPDEEASSADAAFASLLRAGIVAIDRDYLIINNRNSLNLLNVMIKPYLDSFEVLLNVVAQWKKPELKMNEVVPETQVAIARIYESGTNVRLSFLSTDSIKNSFNTLVDRKILTKKSDGFTLNSSALSELLQRVSTLTKSSHHISLNKIAKL